MTYDLWLNLCDCVFFRWASYPTITTHQIITLQTKMPSFWLSTQSCETIRNHACFAGSHHNISTHQTFTKNTIHMHPKFGSSGSKGVVVCHMPTRSVLVPETVLGGLAATGANERRIASWISDDSLELPMIRWCLDASRQGRRFPLIFPVGSRVQDKINLRMYRFTHLHPRNCMNISQKLAIRKILSNVNYWNRIEHTLGFFWWNSLIFQKQRVKINHSDVPAS